MRRYPDWPARLAAFLEDARRRPYALGTWDCAIFCAHGVQAITGELPIDLEGRYSTRLGMAKALLPLGRNFAEALTGVLQRRPVSPRQARRGDVLLRRDAEGLEHLALCGGHEGLAPAEIGFVGRPLREFTLAWGIA